MKKIFSMPNMWLGLPQIYLKEVSSQESRSCFEFKSSGRKCVILESSGGLGLKVNAG